MTEITVTLPELHSAQAEIVDNLGRFNVVICGRRFGKTELLKEVIANDLLDGKRVAYFTPTYRMGSEVWRAVIAMFDGLIRHVDNGERRLELITGGVLECWSLTANTAQSVRGRKYHRLLMDEAAYIRDGTIWGETLRPLLTDYKGGAIFATTPKGRNWVWELYMRGIDPLQPKWKAFHYPTIANPYIDPEEIEDARHSLPERVFKQEYLAEFGDDGGTVFRGVEKISLLQPTDFTYDRSHQYVMAIDWGRDVDFTCATVIDRTTMRQVDLIRFNQIGWAVQRDRVRRLYDKWMPSVCLAEENSIGSVNIEALQAEGMKVTPFMTTAESKKNIIEGLALKIERESLTLLNDDVQKGELQAFNYERKPGGGFKYAAPSGMHDDTVMTLAICAHAAELTVPMVTVNYSGLGARAGRGSNSVRDLDKRKGRRGR